jgi:hypothetical protein
VLGGLKAAQQNVVLSMSQFEEDSEASRFSGCRKKTGGLIKISRRSSYTYD